MADQPIKKPSKAGENVLGLLGALGTVAGPLIFGPDFQGNLGAPFSAGADMLRKQREEKSLLDILASTPHTAPLIDHGQALAQAGGLVNNSDLVNHPDVQQMFGVQPTPESTAALGPFDPARLNVGVSQPPQPTSNILQTLQQPAVSTETQQPQDFSSPEFLQKVAALRPDIAEKVISAKMLQSPEDQQKGLLDTIFKLKQIQSFETPAERRQAQMADRQAMLQFQSDLIGGRQKENQRTQLDLQRSKITNKEEENFNNIDSLRNQYRSMLVDVSQGVNPSFAKNLVATVPGGERLLQATDPQFALFRKNIEQSLALYQKVISGVAVSEAESRRLRPTQPQASDSPEVFKTLAENNIKKANELYFLTALNAANRGGDATQYVDSDTLQKYKAVRAAMNHNLSEALANPRVQQLRQELGIDYGAVNIGGK